MNEGELMQEHGNVVRYEEGGETFALYVFFFSYEATELFAR